MAHTGSKHMAHSAAHRCTCQPNLREFTVTRRCVLDLNHCALGYEPKRSTYLVIDSTTLTPLDTRFRPYSGSGKPVEGLSKDAFRLEENGKPQAISLFEEFHSPVVGATPSAIFDQGYSNLAYRNLMKSSLPSVRCNGLVFRRSRTRMVRRSSLALWF